MVGDDDFTLLGGEFDGVLAVVVADLVAAALHLDGGAAATGGDADLDVDAAVAGVLAAAAGILDGDDHLDGTGGDLAGVLVLDAGEEFTAGDHGDGGTVGDRLQLRSSRLSRLRDDNGLVCGQRGNWGNGGDRPEEGAFRLGIGSSATDQQANGHESQNTLHRSQSFQAGSHSQNTLDEGQSSKDCRSNLITNALL